MIKSVILTDFFMVFTLKEEQSEDVADDEKKETKRDWKDEKNQTEGKESGDEGRFTQVYPVISKKKG